MKFKKILHARTILGYERVNSRFHNKKLLINDLIDQLMKIRPARRETAADIRVVVDESKKTVYSLINLGESLWNAFLVYIVCSKLPEDTLSLWEQSCGGSKELSEFSQLEEFLENRIQTLNVIEASGRQNTSQLNSFVAVAERAGGGADEVTGSSYTRCAYCAGNHLLYKCDQFCRLLPHDRLALVRDKKLCTLCLNNHPGSGCRFTWSCAVCKGKHNSLLHINIPPAVITSIASVDDYLVLLPTVELTLKSKFGVPFKFRVLIDQGSMRSFVTEEVMRLLGWDRTASSTMVTGVSGKSARVRGSTSFEVGSVFDKQFKNRVDALILPSLCRALPQVDNQLLPEFQHLLLADPHYYTGGRVDILIGASDLPEFMMDEVIIGSLLAQKTHFGWFWSGQYPSSSKKTPGFVGPVHSLAVVEADDCFLRKFWETEEKVTERDPYSKVEKLCEEFYNETTCVGEDGRYVCRLPLRNNSTFGNSKKVAIANLLRLEKRFDKDFAFKERYVAAMEDYFCLDMLG